MMIITSDLADFVLFCEESLCSTLVGQQRKQENVRDVGGFFVSNDERTVRKYMNNFNIYKALDRNEFY